MSGFLSVLVSYGASAKAAYQKIIASDTSIQSGALFGSTVAISGDNNYIAIGSSLAGSTDDGAVYVYYNDKGKWVEQAKLVASNAVAGDWFGCAVDITKTGDRIVVGAQHANALPFNKDNSGAAYIFQRTGTTWTEELYLSGGDGGSNDYFGNSVAINDDGTAIFISAYGDDDSNSSSVGFVHTYVRNGSSWSGLDWSVDDDVLPTTASEGNAYHGWSVACNADGTRSIEGAPGDNNQGKTNCGVVTIHHRTSLSSAWVKDIWLQPPYPNTGGQFGWSVAMDGTGDRVAIGAMGESPAGVVNAGAAYVYKRTGTVWALEQQLVAGDKEAGDNFGCSVTINDTGDRIAIGSLNSNLPGKNDTGAVYIFDRSGTVWTETIKLIAGDAGIGDKFGTAVSLNAIGDGVVVGSPYIDPFVLGTPVSDAGSAYYYPLVTTTSALNTVNAPVVAPNSPPTGSVTITGTAEEGQLLTATNTLADADGMGTIAYQWKSDGVDIVGATGNTYTLTPTEIGSKITAIASYTDVAGNNESVTSSETAIVTALVVTPSTPEADGYYVGDFNGFKIYISPQSTVSVKLLSSVSTTSTTDGLANTIKQKVTAGSGALYCYNLTRGGHQWYLPAKDELDFAFENRGVLPTGQGFTKPYYQTSTYNSGDYPWLMSQSGGFFNTSSLRGLAQDLHSRAIRREAIPLTGDVPGAAMEGGYFAGFWSETKDGVATHKIIIAPKSTEGTIPGIETGYSDWKMPTYYQMMIVYYFLKPTNTANRLTGGVRTPYKANANPYSVLPYAPNTLLTASVPAQTAAPNFRAGGSQALDKKPSGGSIPWYDVVYDPGIIANGSLQICFDDGGYYGGISGVTRRAIRLVPV